MVYVKDNCICILIYKLYQNIELEVRICGVTIDFSFTLCGSMNEKGSCFVLGLQLIYLGRIRTCDLVGGGRSVRVEL